MHAARAPLAVAALLLAAACSNSPEVMAPEGTLKSGGWIGTGNSIGSGPDQGGIGQIGSGNVVATGEGPDRSARATPSPTRRSRRSAAVPG